MDEFDNLRSSTLVTGYEFVRDSEPSLGRGARFKLASAAPIPVAPAHAVESGERRSICGKMMEKIEGPWPPLMADRCGDCEEAQRALGVNESGA